MLLKIRSQSAWAIAQYCIATVATVFALSAGNLAMAKDDAPGPLDGELVNFGRDVWPILSEKCLVCHGPDDAKNDFRVDLEDSMADYIEGGDLESSSLWVDYLITDDADMRMPPPDSDVGKLSGAQLALLKVWIEEGAQWGEVPEAEGGEAVEEEEVPLAESMSDAAKWWRFSGLFHPASVHFPIALLVVSAGFVMLSFINRTAFEPVAFHCLWIGALGAVAASILGWSYAQSEGYGAMSFDLGNSAVDRHRWLGIAAAVVALILIPTARSVRRTGDTGMRMLWMLGSLVAVGAVSIAGYQGGELVYGEDHYLKEYERLFPAEVAEPSEDSELEEAEVSDDSMETSFSDDDQAAGEATGSEADPAEAKPGDAQSDTDDGEMASEESEGSAKVEGSEAGVSEEAASEDESNAKEEPEAKKDEGAGAEAGQAEGSDETPKKEASAGKEDSAGSDAKEEDAPETVENTGEKSGAKSEAKGDVKSESTAAAGEAGKSTEL